jgi:hypothetical protein
MLNFEPELRTFFISPDTLQRGANQPHMQLPGTAISTEYDFIASGL